MKDLSIITNFGCHYSCPYCVTKTNNINVPKTTIQGLDNLQYYIRHLDIKKVTISGGGDPLFNLKDNIDWYNTLFNYKLPPHFPVELHTSYLKIPTIDMFSAGLFDKIVYHCSDIHDVRKIKRAYRQQKVRVVFVVTDYMTEADILRINSYKQYNDDIDELSFRQMVRPDYNSSQNLNYNLDQNSGQNFGHNLNYNLSHNLDHFLKTRETFYDFYYIEQNDYNYYYAENKIYTRFKDFQKTEQ